LITMRVIAALGLIVGLFCLCRISLSDFTAGIFGRMTSGPKGIGDEILEEQKKKKKSYFRREIAEIQEILRDTDRVHIFPVLCSISMVLFAVGAVFAALIGNFFLIPVMAVGLMFVPFWYIKLTASHFKKNVADELETALSIITTAYIRTEDIITSVQENMPYLNPPVKTVFTDFYMKVERMGVSVPDALKEMKGRIKNDVFEEWVDAMIACQDKSSLKTTLVPIVAKLSDMRIVNGELDYLIAEPRKEFMTMAVLVVSNIPLMYFLNKDWYNTLMHTIPGQIVLAICGAAIFISSAFVIALTKPIEYRN